ncbi:hypothetical protein KSC_084240 [Ktedonobacter sp. SOSP1-52]|nr:hypothetical protein KSC_084240 [Ktedonobacter sp. SOSP1-52]
MPSLPLFTSILCRCVGHSNTQDARGEKGDAIPNSVTWGRQRIESKTVGIYAEASLKQSAVEGLTTVLN